jgi:hypothetical protein
MSQPRSRTLRDYLTSEPGRFTSPNHPVPISGPEYLRMLDGTATDAADPTRGVEVLQMEVVAEEQASGDRWIYPADRDLSLDGNPILIHLPQDET